MYDRFLALFYLDNEEKNSKALKFSFGSKKNINEKNLEDEIKIKYTLDTKGKLN